MNQCTVILLDQVNCKIVGLEPTTVRKCVNKLKFKVPGAQFLPSVRLGRWDGCYSYFSVGGGTQIGLLDKILPIIENDRYEIHLDDRRPENNFSFSDIDENFLSEHLWPASHPTHANQPIVMRPHQVQLVNTCLNNTQGIQVAATSAGKTLANAALCKAVEHTGRTITVVPTVDLVKQTAADFKLIGLDVGTFFGDNKDWDKPHTICTWQSLMVLHKDTKKHKKLEDEDIHAFIDGVSTIMWDEVHTANADEAKALLTKVFNHVPIRWGLTGTIPKEEYIRISIESSLGPIIGSITAAELQEAGVLSNCEIQIIQIQDNNKFGSYSDEYAYLVKNPRRLEMIADFVSNIKETGNTLMLVQNIHTGKILQELIEGSIFISGSTKNDDRKTEYDKVATSNNLILIATYGVASTGINIPRIFNLVMLEPGKSFTKTIQSIGRGLRRASDKDFVTIWDICSSTKYSKRHLTSRKAFYRDAKYKFQIVKI